MYEERLYRNLFNSENLVFFDVLVYETDLRIGAYTNLYGKAHELVLSYRKQIMDYIKIHHEFLTSFNPVIPLENAPYIIKKMCDAARRAGTGPMAAVAGAISEMVGLNLLNDSKEIIVENGGDIFIKTDIERKIGVFAGKSPLSNKVAVIIEPDNTPSGICTSSGTVGHSFSYGKADAAVIVSRDSFIADAVATATGNVIKSSDDIEKGLEFASSIAGVQGALIIVGDKMGACGDIKLTGL